MYVSQVGRGSKISQDIELHKLPLYVWREIATKYGHYDGEPPIVGRELTTHECDKES